MTSYWQTTVITDSRVPGRTFYGENYYPVLPSQGTSFPITIISEKELAEYTWHPNGCVEKTCGTLHTLWYPKPSIQDCIKNKSQGRFTQFFPSGEVVDIYKNYSIPFYWGPTINTIQPVRGYQIYPDEYDEYEEYYINYNNKDNFPEDYEKDYETPDEYE